MNDTFRPFDPQLAADITKTAREQIEIIKVEVKAHPRRLSYMVRVRWRGKKMCIARPLAFKMQEPMVFVMPSSLSTKGCLEKNLE